MAKLKKYLFILIFLPKYVETQQIWVSWIRDLRSAYFYTFFFKPSDLKLWHNSNLQIILS